MHILKAFGNEYEIPFSNWSWLTVDQDGTLTVFTSDADDEFDGEPISTQSNMNGGYWSNPNGPMYCWREVGKIKRPEDWTLELYALDDSDD